MKIHDYIELLLSKKNKAAMVAIIPVAERPVASESDIKQLIETLNDHFRANRHHNALATALALVMANADETIARLRRTGTLRASRYNFRAGCVVQVVQGIYEVRHLLKVRPDRIVYLESVLALYSLASEVRRLRESILMRLRLRKKMAPTSPRFQ